MKNRTYKIKRRCNDPRFLVFEWQFKKLYELPSTKPMRKKGKWIDICDGYTDYVKCDQCGGILDYKKNFCPNCGADMRGEEDGRQLQNQN